MSMAVEQESNVLILTPGGRVISGRMHDTEVLRVWQRGGLNRTLASFDPDVSLHGERARDILVDVRDLPRIAKTA